MGSYSFVSATYHPAGAHTVNLAVRGHICYGKMLPEMNMIFLPARRISARQAQTSFPSVTKTEERPWLPSLHHGDQTDGDWVKLNANHPGRRRKEERGAFSLSTWRHFRRCRTNAHHTASDRGRWCLAASLGLAGLIGALQSAVCWVGGDGPADRRRFDLFSPQRVAPQQGLDVSSSANRAFCVCAWGWPAV